MEKLNRRQKDLIISLFYDFERKTKEIIIEYDAKKDKRIRGLMKIAGDALILAETVAYLDVNEDKIKRMAVKLYNNICKTNADLNDEDE